MFDRIPEETEETPVQATKEPSKQVVKPSGEKAVKTPAKRKKRK
jgi:hypothetical protein